MRTLSIIAACSVLLAGCFDNVETVFPPGLEPWEDPNEAPSPEPTADEPYPEQITFVRKCYTGGLLSVHSRAYVHSDVQTTFDAVRHPLAGADRRAEVTFTWVEDVDDAYEYTHRSHLVVPDIVTVEFELEWRSGVVERNAMDMPTITATRWQKVWGSTAIAALEGSFVCVEIEPGVTELQIQYHLDALSQGYETIESYLTRYYESVLAYVRGEVADPSDPASWPLQDW